MNWSELSVNGNVSVQFSSFLYLCTRLYGAFTLWQDVIDTPLCCISVLAACSDCMGPTEVYERSVSSSSSDSDSDEADSSTASLRKPMGLRLLSAFHIKQLAWPVCTAGVTDSSYSTLPGPFRLLRQLHSRCHFIRHHSLRDYQQCRRAAIATDATAAWSVRLSHSCTLADRWTEWDMPFSRYTPFSVTFLVAVSHVGRVKV